MSVTMQYGSYSFSPVPLFSWSTEMVRDGRGSGIALRNSLDFTGTFLETSGDASNISDIVDARSGLLAALEQDHQEFKILENGSGLVSGVYPRISELSMDEGVWADKASYSFSAVWEEAIGSNTVQDFSETWSYEEQEDNKTASVSHSLSAVGINTSTSGNNSLANARTFVSSRATYSNSPASHPAFVQVSGSYSGYEGRRSEDVDVTGGAFSVSQVFTLSDTAYIHNQRSSLSVSAGITSLQIDGEIVGLGRTTTALTNALSGWTSTVRDNLATDASGAYTALGGSATLYTANPVSETLSQDEQAGTLTYSREYSDSEEANLPSGIDTLDISVQDSQPVELSSSFGIFGRTLGNVVQTMGTPTEGSYVISGSAKAEQGYAFASLTTYVESRINALRPLSGNFTTLRLESQNVTTDENANEIQFSLTWKYTKPLSSAKVDGTVDLS